MFQMLFKYLLQFVLSEWGAYFISNTGTDVILAEWHFNSVYCNNDGLVFYKNIKMQWDITKEYIFNETATFHSSLVSQTVRLISLLTLSTDEFLNGKLSLTSAWLPLAFRLWRIFNYNDYYCERNLNERLNKTVFSLY
jgi:hypothetical protein